MIVKTNYLRLDLALAFSTLLALTYSMQAQTTIEKPRTIVTTDGEIDDVDSFIRMLLYANEFQIEGLIYSSSMWHYRGDGKGTRFTSEMEMTKKLYGERTDLRWPGTQWMQDLIDAYQQVYPNLIQHADGYPTAEALKKLIRVGNIDFEGEMEKDTEGSEFIKMKLLDSISAPIYLQVWGGTNTIARALKAIEERHKDDPEWENIYKKVSEKAIIYAIMDQDATYRNYISAAWPDIRIYYNSNQFWSLAYNWKKAVPEVMHKFLQGTFMGEHIIKGHGPLTKMYYSYGDGQKQEGDEEHVHGDPTKLKNAQWGSFEKYDFISEGDSPAFLHLIDVGLDNLEHPHFGGWGGRLVPSETHANRWEDGERAAEYNHFKEEMDPAYPQTRWLEALQMDFAARSDWCVQSYEEANHPPVVTLGQADRLSVEPGQSVWLSGNASDPDGDDLNYRWWVYKEVGSYPGEVSLERFDTSRVGVSIPKDLKRSETIHIIFQVTDSSFPNLTRYKRVVLTGS